MNKKSLNAFAIAFAIIVGTSCLSPYLSQSCFADTDFSAEVALAHRFFWQSPAYPNQLEHQQSSILIQPEWSWQAEQGNLRANFIGFYRWDDRDSKRSHADIREAYLLYQANTWDLLVGINKVFWGVTESRHLVDIINQIDALEDIDQEDKLGQPMINLNIQLSWGEWGLFLLPRFRPLAFPGDAGRYRAPFFIDEGNAIYESSDGDQHLDWALRYSHVLGNLDLGLSYFDGTNREARLVPGTTSGTLNPFYDLMTQSGIDLQYTGEEWLLKLEAFYRDTQVDDFAATVIGFEYTFYQVFDGAADMGFILEYLWDDRNFLSPATSFDRDLFFGSRYTFNDSQDTQILGGFIIDTDHQHTFVTFEAERRLTDRWVAELTIRAVLDASAEDPLNFITTDNHLRIKISWFY